MLLLRGATRARWRGACGIPGFNTCSSCEEQPASRPEPPSPGCFNTCSSCEEQLERQKGFRVEILFQYMLLLRGATARGTPCPRDPAFQYMLLLRGATHMLIHNAHRSLRFNTCSSCEEQLRTCGRSIRRTWFQYMLLLRGATEDGVQGGFIVVVSIHAPLARSNFCFAFFSWFYICFNTCSSCEEQLEHFWQVIVSPLFQYMLLLRGATRAWGCRFCG